MTLTWIPDAGVTITEHADAYRWGDFLKNFIVASGGFLCSKGAGNKDLNIANGNAFIKGWKATAASHTKTFTEGDGTWYCYLVNTISGDNASFDLSLYSSEQADVSDKIYLCTFPIASGIIGTVSDKRYQFQSIDSTRVEIISSTAATKTLLSDWRHSSDLSKIDGAKIYDGSIPNAKLTDLTITNAKIATAADIVASKILLSGTTCLDSWRYPSDLTLIDGSKIYNGTIANAQIADAAAVTWTKISKAGSNLTDLATRQHNDLTTFQGGASGEYYHLSSTQQSNLTGGTTAGDSQHRHTSLLGLATTYGTSHYSTERSTAQFYAQEIEETSCTISGCKAGDLILALGECMGRVSIATEWGDFSIKNLTVGGNCLTTINGIVGTSTITYGGITCMSLLTVTSDGDAKVAFRFGIENETGSVYGKEFTIIAWVIGKAS